jgi:hypothetical protein
MGTLLEGNFPQFESENPGGITYTNSEHELQEDDADLQQELVFRLAETIHEVGVLAKKGFNDANISGIKQLRIREHRLRDGMSREAQEWAETTAEYYPFEGSEPDKLNEEIKEQEGK